MTELNRRFVLASRPSGAPGPQHFRLEETPLPEPGHGQALLRTRYLSVDPYMRGRMSAAKSYAAPVQIGQTMVGATVAEVVESDDAAFAPGDWVLAHGGWQTYSVQDASGLRRLDPASAPVTTALGVLGMPGFTAYAGLLEIGRPRPGETVVVAAATGPVGSAVGQIAKLRGARTIGIAGGPEKVAALADFGFDAALDHRDPALAQQLAAAAPDGIDVYFENVSGPVWWDAVLPLLNTFARVPVCGLAALYNGAGDLVPPGTAERLMNRILRSSLTVRGFIQSEFVAALEDDFLRDMTGWVADGSVKYLEDITHGFDRAPEVFAGMLEGKNFGKTIIEV